jgi:hypothetical protein
MLSSASPKFIIRLPIREEKKVAAQQTTKASKQSTIRKTVAKDGDWLSTKSKAVKRKKATTTKVKPTKKAKAKATAKAATKSTATKKPAKVRRKKEDSNEVIELSSDDDDGDDAEPDVMLASLKHASETEVEEVLWDDDNDDSGDEYEFDD